MIGLLLLLLTLFIVIPFALVFAAFVSAAVITMLRKGPILIPLVLALVGVLVGAGFAALRRRSTGSAWRAAHAAYRSDSARTAHTTTRNQDGNRDRDADDVRKLIAEIKEILRTSPISARQKEDLQAQIRDVPENTARALNKLHRLQKIKQIANRSRDASYVADVLHDIESLENQLLAQLERMRRTLLDISIALMKVDTAKGEATLERLTTELSETNRCLNDLADSYHDVRAQQSYRYQ